MPLSRHSVLSTANFSWGSGRRGGVRGLPPPPPPPLLSPPPRARGAEGGGDPPFPHSPSFLGRPGAACTCRSVFWVRLRMPSAVLRAAHCAAWRSAGMAADAVLHCEQVFHMLRTVFQMLRTDS